MAKYTILFADYLNGGRALPVAFAEISGFENLFVAHYCDREIGFETESLFEIKLDARANEVIPIYKQKLDNLTAAFNDGINNPTRTQTRTYTAGARRSSSTVLPMNVASATPRDIVNNDTYTDTDATTYNGTTLDEAIKRAEYWSAEERNRYVLILECLQAFDNLFMEVF